MAGSLSHVLSAYSMVYVLWTLLTLGAVVFVAVGVCSGHAAVPGHVFQQLIILFGTLLFLGYLEGLRVAALQLAAQDSEGWKESSPRARAVCRLLCDRRQQQRFLFGRQCLATLATFLFARVTTFPGLERPSLCPYVLWFVLVETGLPGALVAHMLGQCIPQFIASQHPAAFYDLRFSYTLLQLALVIDSVGAGKVSWSLAQVAARLIGLQHVSRYDDEAPRSESESDITRFEMALKGNVSDATTVGSERQRAIQRIGRIQCIERTSEVSCSDNFLCNDPQLERGFCESPVLACVPPQETNISSVGQHDTGYTGLFGEIADVGRRSQESIDDLISSMWPLISKVFEEQMRDVVEPLVQRVMPMGITFSFATCHLGTTPIMFRNIETNTCSQARPVECEDIQNVRIVADVDYHGDCEIEVDLSVAKLHLIGLEFRGTIIVELVKLMTTPPWFNGVRIYFPNMPEVDIRTDSEVLGLSINFGFVRSKIIEAVTDGISDLAVLPNRWVLDLGYGIDAFNLKRPPPEGVLRVAVVEARGLNVSGLSHRADPYVEIRLGADSWCTPVVSDSLNPKWAEDAVHDFIVTDSRIQLVHATVRDADYGLMQVGKQSDLLGRTEVSIARLLNDREESSDFGRWMALESESGQDGQVDLYLAAQWRPFAPMGRLSKALAANPELNRWCIGGPGEAAWAIFLDLYYCSGLPATGQAAEHWVSVSVSGGREDAAPDLKQESASVQAQRPLEEGVRSMSYLLGVPPDVLVNVLSGASGPAIRQNLFHRETSDLAASEERAGSRLVDVKWDCSFSFLVRHILSATVTLTVKRQADAQVQSTSRMHRGLRLLFHGSGDDSTHAHMGSVSYPLKDLLQSPKCSAIVRDPLEAGEGAGLALLKFRLQARPLQPPAMLDQEAPSVSFPVAYEDGTSQLPAEMQSTVLVARRASVERRKSRSAMLKSSSIVFYTPDESEEDADDGTASPQRRDVNSGPQDSVVR